MAIAVVLLTAPNRPRVTYLTRDFVEKVVSRVNPYFDAQSGGRAVGHPFEVFDWYRAPLTDDEWKNAGWNLGTIITPLYKRDRGIDLATYARVVFVTDVQEAQSAAWAPASDYRFLHVGAQSLNPALLQHEFGHPFGCNHANADRPFGPAEYLDPFCVMGAEGFKYSFPDGNLDFRTDFGQVAWRYCQNCSGMFHDGDPIQKGVCPGVMIPVGHVAQGFEFVLPHRPPATAQQQNGWRYCNRCRLLVFEPEPGDGPCPAGSVHSLSLALDYTLAHDVTDPGQPDWRRCAKCHAMYFAGNPAQGVCAAGAAHTPAAGGPNYVLPHSLAEHDMTGPGLIASSLVGGGWLDVRAHGADIGPALRTRPGTVTVELFRLRGAPRGAFSQPPALAWADRVANDRLLVEYRTDESWDVALPDSAPGTGGWVLVHLTNGAPPGVSSLLVAQLSDAPGSTAYIPDAMARITTVSRDPARGTVVVRLDSDPLPTVGDLVNKQILPQTSPHSPALVSDHDRVFLAWTGAGPGQLNLLVSTDDGATFTARHTSPETSRDAPALALCAGVVYIAWAGQDDGTLNVARVAHVQTPAAQIGLFDKVTLPETSPVRPALAADLHGNLYLAWTGHGGGQLNLLISPDRGQTWFRDEKKVFGQTSTHGPALVSYAGGRMYLAWKGSGNENLNVARLDIELKGGDSKHPVCEGMLPVRTLPDTSPFGPALTADRGRLALAWAGEGDGELSVAVPLDSTGTYTRRVFPETSDDAPALTSHRSRIAVAWRGSGNENISVAFLRGRGMIIDDFRTGPASLPVESGQTATTRKSGEVLGGVRTLSVQSIRYEGGTGAVATVDTVDGELTLAQAPGQFAVTHLVYGLDADGTVQHLGVDLRQDGADRLRVVVSSATGGAVHVNATVASGGLWTTNGVTLFAGSGVADLTFETFGGTGGQDFSNVSYLVIILQSAASFTVKSVECAAP
ncbi:hypothetical protein [Catellatospora paridis]|uniref:hypothetical protein n=1 Tax=Catellatospora paridis TaxID=1617086 RepID=UPI0012D4277B|nr:hypothetical protein [Catellatospora paridis]